MTCRGVFLVSAWASQVVQWVKNLPAVQTCKRLKFDPWVGNIPWRKAVVIHSSIFAWRIPVDRGAWWATVHRVVQSRTRVKRLSMHVHLRLSLSFFKSNYLFICGGS